MLVLLHRPPARHNDLRSISLRVDDLSFPAASAEQFRIDLFKGCWEDRLQELVRDLADCLLSGPSIQLHGTAIPVGDDVIHVAHEDRVVREDRGGRACSRRTSSARLRSMPCATGSATDARASSVVESRLRENIAITPTSDPRRSADIRRRKPIPPLRPTPVAHPWIVLHVIGQVRLLLFSDQTNFQLPDWDTTMWTVEVRVHPGAGLQLQRLPLCEASILEQTLRRGAGRSPRRIGGESLSVRPVSRTPRHIGANACLTCLRGSNLFRLLPVFDIGTRAVPLDDVSQLVAQRHGAEQEPAILPVSSPNACFSLERFPGRHGSRHSSTNLARCSE